MRTRIKTMEPKTYQGKPNGYKIVLEDNTEGNLVEKDSDKGLRVGDTVEATITDYVSKSKGTHSNLITLKLVSETQQKSVQAETKATPPKGAPIIDIPSTKGMMRAKSIVEMKYESLGYTLKLIVKLVAVGKLELKEVKETFNDWTDMLSDSIDALKE